MHEINETLTAIQQQLTELKQKLDKVPPIKPFHANGVDIKGIQQDIYLSIYDKEFIKIEVAGRTEPIYMCKRHINGLIAALREIEYYLEDKA